MGIFRHAIHLHDGWRVPLALFGLVLLGTDPEAIPFVGLP